MTNGTLTKKILKAAKTETGKALLETAKKLMEQFPLSSHHLLYDQDQSKVPAEAWPILVQAAVDTDKKKLDRKNDMLRSFGMSEDDQFGRYTKK